MAESFRKTQSTWNKSDHVSVVSTGPDKVSIHFVNHQLCYSGQNCRHIPETLAKLYGDRVEILDLSFNALISLRGLESFKNLRELILDNNELNDNLVLPYLHNLHTLSLNKNNINELELLIQQICNKLPNLTYLSLLGNKACPNQLSDSDKDEDDYKRYRYYVLYNLPKLKFLDSTSVSSSERSEASRRGKFMRVARPKETKNVTELASTLLDCDSSQNPYTPLPVNQRSLDDHKGAYGKCRYRYSGKHSEGNRFIRNNDL